ncbi:MAG: histidine phosphatase family protein [Nitrososphaerales archaeon]
MQLIRSYSSDRIGILVRHSAKINTEDTKDYGLLSPLGHAEARRFGRLLPKGYNLNLSYSAETRCVETAKEIMTGYAESNAGNCCDLGAEGFLASFHFFSKNETAMNSYKRIVRGKRFLREWLDNTLPEGIMTPIENVRAFVAEYFQRQMQGAAPPLLRVWIGHDFGIMMIREFLFGGKFEDLPWIQYLDGIVFTSDSNNSLHARWNDKITEIKSLNNFGESE